VRQADGSIRGAAPAADRSCVDLAGQAGKRRVPLLQGAEERVGKRALVVAAVVAEAPRPHLQLHWSRHAGTTSFTLLFS